MLPEEEYKKYLIRKLEKINPGWVDGDEESVLSKTVDLVNHNFKIAIEIKDDRKYRYKAPPLTGEMIVESINLLAKNKQFKDDAQDANKKFRNYPEYKTILLIRTELINQPLDVLRYVFSGIRRFVKTDNNRLLEISKLNKYLSISSTKEIGNYLLYGNKKYFYISNPNADNIRVLEKKKIENIFGESIGDIQ